MDEMWQRHKGFILQLLVGGVLFLVAFFVMRSMYGDQNDPEKVHAQNATRLAGLQKQLDAGKAPDTRSIKDQRDNADLGDKQKHELAVRVASVPDLGGKTREADREKAYVAENIDWTLGNLNSQDDNGFKARYDTAPQACLSTLRDRARTVLVGRAAQSGKEIDETLGFGGAFADDEIPEALHGLAIVSDLVARSLAKRKDGSENGIEKVLAIRITTHSSFPDNNGVNFVSAIGVHIELFGDPADVSEIIRSLNEPRSVHLTGKREQDKRITVLESVDYVVPMSQDEDTVHAAFNVVGLRYKSEKQAEGK